MKTIHHSEEALLRLLDEEPGGDMHVAACPMCLERLLFLKQFHRALLEQRSTPVDPRLRPLIESGPDHALVMLKPHTSMPDRPRNGQQEEFIILAAQGGTQAPGRFEVVGTFSALPERMLLRVVLDHEKHCSNLHLLTEKAEDARGVRIVISTPRGEQVTTTTNDDGVAVLREEKPYWWSDVVIAVAARHP